MPGFNIKIDAVGLEREVRRVSMPNAGRKIIQRAFQLSFDKAWATILDEELFDGEFMEDLETGVIAAIFGFTPSMNTKQIEDFKAIFRKKSKTVLVGQDVLSEISIDSRDIGKLKVRHRIRGSGEVIEFKWLEVLLYGLSGDHINAKIMDDIGVEEYVAAESIYSKSLPSGVNENSRSGNAIMVATRNAKVRRFLRSQGENISSFKFRIIPHPFLLNDIFEPLQEKLARFIRRDFAVRINNIPPIKIGF